MFFYQQFLQVSCDSVARDSEHYCNGMRYATDRSVVLEETEIAFLRKWCCDITNDFVYHSDELLV